MVQERHHKPVVGGARARLQPARTPSGRHPVIASGTVCGSAGLCIRLSAGGGDARGVDSMGVVDYRDTEGDAEEPTVWAATRGASTPRSVTPWMTPTPLAADRRRRACSARPGLRSERVPMAVLVKVVVAVLVLAVAAGPLLAMRNPAEADKRTPGADPRAAQARSRTPARAPPSRQRPGTPRIRPRRRNPRDGSADTGGWFGGARWVIHRTTVTCVRLPTPRSASGGVGR
jgi:hypothetical protein